MKHTRMKELKTYEISTIITVKAEDAADALDYLHSAIDATNLLNEDGIIGIEIDEDLLFEASEFNNLDIETSEEED